MKISWLTEIPQWLILAAMLIAAGVLWPLAPDSIPVHWNLKGDVDRFGGKFEGLLLIPLMAVFIYGLLVVLPRFDPGRANYESFRSAYVAIRVGILLFFAGLYAAMLLVTFGYPVKINLVVPFGVGGLFILLGNFMGKIRPNYFVGIRTPWTLSSRHSWNQTHRLGGWLFILMGCNLALLGFVQTVWMLVLTGVVIGGSVIWMMVYSYLVWRKDPEKLSVGSIVPAPGESESQK